MESNRIGFHHIEIITRNNNHGRVNKIVLCSKIINNNSGNTSALRHKSEQANTCEARFILYDKDHIRLENV